MGNVTESASVKENIRVFRQVMYIIILVLSILANVLLVLMLIRKQLRHRRTAKSFICLVQNLAVANILIVVLGIPLDDIWHDSHSYPFGPVGCKIVLPLQSAVFQAMIHLFVGLVVQRCYGVVRSLYGQLKYFHAVFISLFVWIVSLCTAVPYIVMLKYRSSTGCTVQWSSSSYQGYMVVLFLLQYLLPIIFTFILYRVITTRLNRYKVLDPERAIRRDRHHRVLRMFAIFILLFAILLLPKQVMSFIKAFGDPSSTAYFEDVFETLDILAYSMTIISPVLFFIFNPEFSTDFWVFVKCQCFKPSVMMDTTEISDSFSEDSAVIICPPAMESERFSTSTPSFQTTKYELAPQPNGDASPPPDPAFDLVEASMFKSTFNRCATLDRRQEPSPSASPPESDIFESHENAETDDYENEML